MTGGATARAGPLGGVPLDDEATFDGGTARAGMPLGGVPQDDESTSGSFDAGGPLEINSFA